MSWEQADAEQLFEACADNTNANAWREFVRRFGELVTRTAVRTAQRWTDPASELTEDLVQETYIKLLEDNGRVLRTYRREREGAESSRAGTQRPPKDGRRPGLGHWLTEHDIPEGAILTTDGLDNTAPPLFLDATKNIILSSTGLDLRGVYAELQLPYPTYVFPLRTVQMHIQQPNPAGGPLQLLVRPHCPVQVFQYALAQDNDQSQVVISDASVNFAFVSQAVGTGSSAPFIVIHVLNEPESEVPDDHSVEEFNLGAQLLQSPTTTMTLPVPTFPNAGSDQPVRGILDAELQPLSKREQNVFSLLANLRAQSHPAPATGVGGSKVCGSAAGILTHA